MLQLNIHKILGDMLHLEMDQFQHKTILFAHLNLKFYYLN